MQNEILKNMTDQPQLLKRITIEPVSMLDKLLQQLKIREPRSIELNLSASTLRTVQRIAVLRSTISNIHDKNWQTVIDHTETAARVVALAVHNKPTPVPEDLVNAIMDHVSNEELAVIMLEVYRRLDVSSFFGSMGYLDDMTKLIDTQEIEANQPLLEIPNLPTS